MHSRGAHAREVPRDMSSTNQNERFYIETHIETETGTDGSVQQRNGADYSPAADLGSVLEIMSWIYNTADV